MSRKRKFSLTALAVVAALTAPHPVWAEARQTQDFFVGNGTVGPYTLSWKNILSGTETVKVNETPLAWGVDYTLDPAAGTLTFAHPLPAQAGATIQYGYDTKQAQAQGGGLSMPLTFALNENLAVSGIYSHSATDGAKPGALNMGLDGGWQGANDSKLTTHLLFAPAMTGADAKDAPNGLARLGFAANGQTNIGKPLQISFGFSHAGQGVGTLGSDNWKAGLQKMNLNAAFNPSHQVQATFGYLQTDAADGKSPAQSQINAALALTPTDKMHLSTTLAETEGGGKGAVQTLSAAANFAPSKGATLDADFSQKNAADKTNNDQSMNLKAALAGKNLSLVASAGQETVGDKNTVQTLNAAVSDKLGDKSELSASFAQKDSTDTSNNSQKIDLKAALGGKNMALTASATQDSVGTNNTTQNLNAALSLKPMTGATLDATFAQKDATDKTNNAASLDVKGTLTTGKVLSLTADAGQSSAGTQGTVQTLNATAVVKPVDKTELDAAFSQKLAPDQKDSTQALNLKAAIASGKPVSLTASLSQSSQGTQDTSTQAVGLSLTPSHSTLQINTGLSLQHDPTADTQVAGVDGKMQPWAFLLLSGGYQWRTVTASQPGAAAVGNYDSSAAQFTLAPKAKFHLIGTYAQNPTDKDGHLQHSAQHGLGLQTTIGALNLTTDYNWCQQYDTPTTGTSLHVGLGLRVSANTQFTGDYKQDLTGMGLDPTGTSAYSLGLTRDLGEAFNLSLSGTVKQNVGPTPGAPAPDAITASAKLGMKF